MLNGGRNMFIIAFNDERNEDKNIVNVGKLF